jgi:Domain of unknown function (DUF6602)
MMSERGLLQSAMDELSSALSNAVGASSVIDHRLLKGEFRERRVIAGLRPFIPRRYEMTSGVVVNAEGNFSRQQDIILSDSVTVPPILAAGELGVHLVETVRGVIEVKSVATAQSMRDAVANIASVKKLMPDVPRAFTDISGQSIPIGDTFDKPFGGILFLESGAEDSVIRDAFLEEASKLKSYNRPNAAVVVNKFALLWSNQSEEVDALIEAQAFRATQLGFHRLEANALLAFYMVLVKALADYQPPMLNLNLYLKNGGGLGRHEVHTYKVPHMPRDDN